MAKELLKLSMNYSFSLNDVAGICGIDVGYVVRMKLGVSMEMFALQSQFIDQVLIMC